MALSGSAVSECSMQLIVVDDGGGHRLTLAGERLVGLVAEDIGAHNAQEPLA